MGNRDDGESEVGEVRIIELVVRKLGVGKPG